MTSLRIRAKARDRSLRECYGKSYRRPRKNAAYAVFRLDDIYINGVWWPCYSARPKSKVFTVDGRKIRLSQSCENWRDVADRLKKSEREFLTVLRYFGRV